MPRTVVIFLLFAVPVIGMAVSVGILVRSTLSFRRADEGRGFIILRAVGSLTLWVAYSLILSRRFYVLFATSYTAGGAGREAAAKAAALRLIISCVVYVLCGCGLVFFRRPRELDDDELIEIFPKGAT